MGLLGPQTAATALGENTHASLPIPQHDSTPTGTAAAPKQASPVSYNSTRLLPSPVGPNIFPPPPPSILISVSPSVRPYEGGAERSCIVPYHRRMDRPDQDQDRTWFPAKEEDDDEEEEEEIV
ncbi:hypothetical protein DTO271D3_174 [Paecilomyces variotii]|nr:hypothetical protein DTO271D3_174 [Paecilomyces variotii]